MFSLYSFNVVIL